MVKLTPDESNLEPGFTSYPSIFRRMGLYPGDTFENRNGTKLTVREGGKDDRWIVVPAD